MIAYPGTDPGEVERHFRDENAASDVRAGLDAAPELAETGDVLHEREATRNAQLGEVMYSCLAHHGLGVR